MGSAENKTKATKASVATFLGALDERRRKDCRALVAILKRVTKSEPKMWGPSIVGFGDYHYKYESGREADWFEAGFSPRKKDLTLYLMGIRFGDPLFEKLGKHSHGKGCLYIRQLADVDVAVLEKIARGAVRNLRERAR